MPRQPTTYQCDLFSNPHDAEMAQTPLFGVEADGFAKTDRFEVTTIVKLATGAAQAAGLVPPPDGA